MKSFILFILAILPTLSLADHSILLGKAHCRVVGNSGYTLKINFYSSESAKEGQVEYAELSLYSKVESGKLEMVKNWEQVPATKSESINESTFQNSEVYFYYYNDPMSADSELVFEDQNFDLQCELQDE